MTSTFDLTIEERGEAVHVQLSGELDISTGSRLDDDLRRIESGEPALIVLDLSELEFMDSTGLRILITADTRARDAGRRLVLVRGNSMIQRVMRITRLDERFEIAADSAAALTRTA